MAIDTVQGTDAHSLDYFVTILQCISFTQTTEQTPLFAEGLQQTWHSCNLSIQWAVLSLSQQTEILNVVSSTVTLQHYTSP